LTAWLTRAQAEAAAQPLVFSLEVPAGHFFSATLSPVQPDEPPHPRPVPGVKGEREDAPAGEEGGLARGRRGAGGWVLVLQDSSQLRRAEEWKAEAIQSATHDLRNPINLMNGALNLLRDSLKSPTAEQKECIAMLRSGLDRMGSLVEQVLNLDQVTGRAEPALAGVDLRRVAEQATEELRLAAEEKGLTLSFAGPAQAGRVLGDESWLHRAVANLLNNAIKYTPRAGRVTVQYHETDGQAVCEVTDTGPGIPPAAQARLFERFYRVPGETTRRAPGTGLGLAIVKTIVERHSGRVWVSSGEGQGSTFGFAVPLASAEDAASLKAGHPTG
jgi:signal transduction histidine kinase